MTGREDRRDAPSNARVHMLHAADVSFVVAVPPAGLPEVVHWGASLEHAPDADGAALLTAFRRGVSPSGLDRPWRVSLVPSEPEGWRGRPAIAGHRAGAPILPRWASTSVEADSSSIRVIAVCEGLELDASYRLDAAGVLRVSLSVTNTGATPLEITTLEATAPVGDAVTEVLDFAGRWVRERSPQRGPLLAGSRTRQSMRGRTGHDAPLLTAVGTPGFSDASGEVWAAHLAWSGDAVYRTDANHESDRLIGAGPLLRAGEIVLLPEERFTAPDVVFTWSGRGLDGLAARLHRSLRNRPWHPSPRRPVTLNTWEAVYFDQRFDRLSELARTAAEIGVERFVLDDGWFTGRRSDTAGLGDWQVDRTVWPSGLHPLVDLVRELEMEFGLWVEPEMVNLDSDLARRHPEWLLAPEQDEPPLAWRNQHVLDLTRSDVFDYLLASISALVSEYRLDFLKWDQNRDLLEAVSANRSAVHTHTGRVYDLIDALRERHPHLEIESCASGGARVDLGIMHRTDRVWASDTNDPVERLRIQRWTELLIPLELIGSHVGPPSAHTTKRTTSLSFRIAVALFGSFGVEWDITACTPDELDELRDGALAYKRLRPLLHSGELAHLDTGDPGLTVTSVVADDRSHAIVRIARSESAERSLPPRLRVPGLEPTRRYLVAPVAELRLPQTADIEGPEWLRAGQVTMSGAALAAAGVRLPMLHPAQALVLEITAL